MGVGRDRRASPWSSVGTVLLLSATRLDAFAFGDTSAAALGIDVDRTRWTLMTVVALLTGAMVAVSGAIGFVGLILPHAVSSLTGPAHRRLLPVAALSGAVFLIWADTLARTVFDPRELPVGIVTALIGVPGLRVPAAPREGVGMDLTLDGVGTRLGGRWVVDGIDATPPAGAPDRAAGPERRRQDDAAAPGRRAAPAGEGRGARRRRRPCTTSRAGRVPARSPCSSRSRRAPCR